MHLNCQAFGTATGSVNIFFFFFFFSFLVNVMFECCCPCQKCLYYSVISSFHISKNVIISYFNKFEIEYECL